jgi:hypothetical protein
MFSSTAADDLIGKRIIVGITYEDRAHRPVRQEQYHGTISRLNLQEGIVIQTPSGTEKTLPPDLRAVLGARPGAYRFRSTGELVADAELVDPGICRRHKKPRTYGQIRRSSSLLSKTAFVERIRVAAGVAFAVFLDHNVRRLEWLSRLPVARSVDCGVRRAKSGEIRGVRSDRLSHLVRIASHSPIPARISIAARVGRRVGHTHRRSGLQCVTSLRSSV